ncbi:hypothetical protein DXG01_001321 [Tephrocybe rancida]|nr:hypothetical protein DXG01_001321 [Tephrocybe rancida]
MPFLLLPLSLLLILLTPLIRTLLRQLRSPLRHLPGPPSPSLLTGSLAALADQENTPLLRDWEQSYGPTYAYAGFLSGPRLMTTDPTALAHILGRPQDYQKPEFVRDSLARMGAGYEGLLTAEGEAHRRMRRVVGPAFSKTHLRSLTPVFEDKARMLSGIWGAEADEAGCAGARLDVMGPLARATLDVIGEAGFGYQFHALQHSQDELASAFALIFATGRKFRLITILQAWVPFLRHFRHDGTAAAQAHATMHRIGSALVAQKRKEMEADAQPGRDLLSLLIRSSPKPTPTPTAKPPTPAPESLTDPETLSQISTFLAAGHETAASALTWCLFALASSPSSQSRLRRALQCTEGGDVEQCEYLEWVVRESLRLHAPVNATMRVCARPGGDVVPLSVPLRPTAKGPLSVVADMVSGIVRGGGGKETEGQMHVRLAEGDILTIPIQGVNRCERVWGPDAAEFRKKEREQDADRKIRRPERWAAPPPEARAVPGVMGGTMTFLGGERAIKVFLATLVRDLEFSIDEGLIIEKRIK